MKFNFEKLKSWSGLIGTFIALAALSFSIIKSCENTYEKRLEKYNTDAAKYRSMLAIDKTPIVNDIYYYLDTTWLDYYTGIHSIKSKNDLPREGIVKDIRLDVTFSVRNVSTIPTKIVAILISDTNSTYQFLKYDFLYKKFVITENNYDKFYQSAKLIHGQTYKETFKQYKIQNFTDSSFVLHFMIIYENEQNVMFYTYYTIQYNFFLKNIGLTYEQIKKAQRYPRLMIQAHGNVAQINDIKSDTDLYSLEFSQIIDEYFIKYSKKMETEINKGKTYLNK